MIMWAGRSVKPADGPSAVAMRVLPVRAGGALVILLAASAAIPPASSASLDLSFESASAKVFLDRRGPGPRNSVAVKMARGEYESFQLLVSGAGGALHNVRVHASPPRAYRKAGGAAIRVEVGLVGFVETRPDDRRPWGKAVRLGWWPDPILPNRPFDVAAEGTQPVWITLFALSDALPGAYTGELRVDADGGRHGRCSYQVEVFPVELPKTQRLRNAAFMPAGNLNAHYNPSGGIQGEKFLQLYERWARFAFERHLGPAFDMLMGWNQTKLRNPQEAGSLGVTPDMIAGGDPAAAKSYVTWPVRQLPAGYDFRTASDLLALGREYGLERFCIALFDREQRWEQQDPEVRSAMADLLRAYVSALRKRGAESAAYVYNADEPGPAMWDTVKKNYSFIRAVDPGLRVWLCLNEIAGVRALAGYTDLWDVYIHQYEQSGVEVRRQAGEAVIWGLCVYPHEHPNLFIEYPAMDARVVGWLTYRYGVSGFEYWGLNQWGKNTGRTQWASFESGDTRTRWQRTDWPLGDGWLLYPGPEGEPLSSVRFENLRDGFEDAELLLLLDARGKGARARSLAQRVAATTQEFASDPAIVESAHEALLRAFSEE